MFIKKLFFIIPVLIPFLAQSMEQDAKRMRRESSDLAVVAPAAAAAEQPVAAELSLLDQQIQEIRIALANFDLALLRNLLAQPVCKELTAQQRALLLQDAENIKAQIQQMHTQGASITSNTTNPELKRKFSYEAELGSIKNIGLLFTALQKLKNLRFPQAVMGPKPYRNSDLRPSLDSVLSTLIKNEQEGINASCFHVTLYNIAELLVARYREGLPVNLLTSQTQGETAPLNAISLLINSGVPVAAPMSRQPYETNHHKFFIFRCNNTNAKRLLWVGSYNATGFSNFNSWEDVTIIDDEEVIQDYSDRFTEIQSCSTRLNSTWLAQQKQTETTSFTRKINHLPSLGTASSGESSGESQ